MFPSAPRRLPAAMYVHCIRRYWHCLLGISEFVSLRLIFRSYRRGNPQVGATRFQASSGSPNTKLPIRPGVSGPPSDPASSPPREYLHSNTTFSRPRDPVAHLALSPCDLSGSLQFGLSSLPWLLSLPCLLPLLCLLSLPLAKFSSARSMISLARMWKLSSLFFPRILWTIRNLTNLQIFQQTHPISLSRGVNFVPFQRHTRHYYIACNQHSLLLHKLHLINTLRWRSIYRCLIEQLRMFDFSF